MSDNDYKDIVSKYITKSSLPEIVKKSQVSNRDGTFDVALEKAIDNNKAIEELFTSVDTKVNRKLAPEEIVISIMKSTLNLASEMTNDPINVNCLCLRGIYSQTKQLITDGLCDKIGLLHIDLEEWIKKNYTGYGIDCIADVCADMRWLHRDWTKTHTDDEYIKMTHDRVLRKYKSEYKNRIFVFYNGESIAEKFKYCLIQIKNSKLLVPKYFKLEQDAQNLFEEECDELAKNWKLNRAI